MLVTFKKFTRYHGQQQNEVSLSEIISCIYQINLSQS